MLQKACVGLDSDPASVEFVQVALLASLTPSSNPSSQGSGMVLSSSMSMAAPVKVRASNKLKLPFGLVLQPAPLGAGGQVDEGKLLQEKGAEVESSSGEHDSGGYTEVVIVGGGHRSGVSFAPSGGVPQTPPISTLIGGHNQFLTTLSLESRGSVWPSLVGRVMLHFGVAFLRLWNYYLCQAKQGGLSFALGSEVAEAAEARD